MNIRGADWDEETGTLTVETWSPDADDLVINLLRTSEDVRGLMNSTSPRVEAGLFNLRRIIIKRPAGGLEE